MRKSNLSTKLSQLPYFFHYGAIFDFLKYFLYIKKNMSTCFVFLMKNVIVVDILPLKKYVDHFFSHFVSGVKNSYFPHAL